MIDISVIIPTYKPKDYIFECLTSFINQSFPFERFEIILVLNGCKEPYESDIKRFISKQMHQMNVIYVQTDQGGVSYARNFALDIAKGEYITFVDDDDYVSEGYLMELFSKASKSTISLARPIAFNDLTKDIDKNYSIEREFFRCSSSGIQFFYKPKKFFSGPCMKLIHKNIIGNRRFDVNFKNGEDSLFMFLISDRMKYVDFTSAQAIYYRRIRLNSAISNNHCFFYRLKNSSRMIKEYIKIYCSNYINYNEWFLFTRILGALRSIVNI